MSAERPSLWLPAALEAERAAEDAAKQRLNGNGHHALLVDDDDYDDWRDPRGLATSKDMIGDLIAQRTLELGWAVGPTTTSEALDLFRKSLFVFSCVSTIASKLSSIPLIAVQVGKDGRTEDDPQSELQALLDAPSDYATLHEILERYVAFLLLAGTSYLFAEREGKEPDDPRAIIARLRVLKPTRVEIVPGAGPGGIALFRHDLAGKSQDIHPLNVAMVTLFNPQNDYLGMPPSQPIGKTLTMDEEIETYNATSLSTGGFPSIMLTTKAVLTETQRRRRERWWNLKYGKGRSGGVFVGDGDTDVKPLVFSPKDMQFLDMSKITEHRILSAYGVPPILVMDLRDASVLANADTQLELFYDGTLRPLGTRIEASLNRLFKGDPRFQQHRVRLAWEKVEVHRRAEEKRREQSRNDYQAGIVTLNEAREAAGYEPHPDGDAFRQPAPSPFAIPGGNEPGEKRVRIVRAVQLTPEYKALRRATYRGLRREWEPKATGTMRGFFGDQRDRLLAKVADLIGHKSAAKAHRTHDFADEGFLGAIFDLTAENKALREKLGPLFLAAMVDAGNRSLEAVFEGKTVEAISENTARIRNAFEKWVGIHVTRVNDETRLSIRDVLVRAFEDGWDGRRVEKELGELLAHWSAPAKAGFQSRAERIADTEMTVALNTGAFESSMHAVETTGARLRKTWLSSRDDRVRASHVEMDDLSTADPLPMGIAFPNGLMHPGDASTADAAEVVNCILPGTRVSGAFVGGLKAWYSGPAREIQTARGHWLSITPNHPVLTTEGLVPAGAISEGMYLLCDALDVRRAMLRDVHDQHGPALVEDIFQALARQRGLRLAMVGALDLHGDARRVVGQVHVVGTDFAAEPETFEPINEFALASTDRPIEARSHRARAPNLHLERIDSPPAGRPGVSALTLDAGPVALEDGPLDVLRLGPAAEAHAVLTEAARQNGAAYVEFVRELLDARAFPVAPDRVVQVREFDWSGHVYDLQAVGGWYVSNGIGHSNCRCSLMEILEP